MRRRAGHVLATVLFTDIVDSSRLAKELGDRRWRVLLARHHATVRKLLRRYGGREIDNAGDGFFASFRDQVDAVRCACAISDEVKELGINVRAGVHVGQAEVVGRKLGGVTVHVGARVMAEATPGQVLVSSTIKDLVPASDLTFSDEGIRHLKGVDGDWRLWAVTAVDGVVRPPPLDPAEAAKRREAIKPPPVVLRRWGRLALAALALVLAGGSILAYALLRHPPPVRVLPDSLVRIDPQTNKIAAAIPVALPNGQIAIVPPHAVWVLSQPNGVISEVDARTEKTQTLGVFGGRVISPLPGGGLVYAAGRVWVSGGNNLVEAIRPETGTVSASVHIPGAPALLAAGFGRVWVLVHDAQLVEAIDPDSATVVQRAPIGRGGNGIGVGEGAVWVSSYEDSTVTEVDPQSGRTTTIHLDPFAGPATVATGFGSAWVSDVASGYVDRIDPATTKIVASIKVGAQSAKFFSDIAALGGSMWVTSPRSKTVVRIDPATNKVTATIPLRYPPEGLVVGDGSVWVTVGPTATSASGFPA